MMMVVSNLARSAVMVPLTIAVYGAVMIGLIWVTIVESGFSARRLFGWMPKELDIPPFDGPIQTL
jgi:hypothetical protein